MISYPIKSLIQQSTHGTTLQPPKRRQREVHSPLEENSATYTWTLSLCCHNVHSQAGLPPGCGRPHLSEPCQLTDSLFFTLIPKRFFFLVVLCIIFYDASCFQRLPGVLEISPLKLLPEKFGKNVERCRKPVEETNVHRVSPLKRS